MNFACTAVSGRAFHGSVTLTGKAFFLVFCISCFKSLGADSLYYKFSIFFISIMSPHKCLCASECSFSDFNIST